MTQLAKRMRWENHGDLIALRDANLYIRAIIYRDRDDLAYSIVAPLGTVKHVKERTCRNLRESKAFTIKELKEIGYL